MHLHQISCSFYDIYIFKLVSTFSNIMTIIVTYYGGNEVSKCFVQLTCSNTFESHCSFCFTVQQDVWSSRSLFLPPGSSSMSLRRREKCFGARNQEKSIVPDQKKGVVNPIVDPATLTFPNNRSPFVDSGL